MLYGIFDKNGRIETAVNDETITEIPDGKNIIELNNAQWENRFDLKLSKGKLIHDPILKDNNE